jgi:hypothetical protein
MSAQLRLIKPRHKNRSVPARPPNAELCTREYLTPAEVEKLIKGARQGRYPHRDGTLILIATGSACDGAVMQRIAQTHRSHQGELLLRGSINSSFWHHLLNQGFAKAGTGPSTTRKSRTVPSLRAFSPSP